MDTTYKVAEFQIRNVLRSLWLIIYAIGLALSTMLIIYFTNDSSKVAVSLLTITLVLNPLVSILFGSIYIYNAREFIELLLTQPIKRQSIFLGIFLGLVLPFVTVTLVGLGLPLLFSGAIEYPLAFSLIMMGILVQLIFVSLASLLTIFISDKSVGLGIAFLLWLTLCWIYDGAILFISFAFQDYPIEKVLLILTILNPIDLARISILSKLDTAAMLGITGAIFKSFLEETLGNIISFSVFLGWTFVPLYFAYKKFIHKDF